MAQIKIIGGLRHPTIRKPRHGGRGGESAHFKLGSARTSLVDPVN